MSKKPQSKTKSVLKSLGIYKDYLENNVHILYLSCLSLVLSVAPLILLYKDNDEKEDNSKNLYNFALSFLVNTFFTILDDAIQRYIARDMSYYLRKDVISKLSKKSAYQQLLYLKEKSSNLLSQSSESKTNLLSSLASVTNSYSESCIYSCSGILTDTLSCSTAIIILYKYTNSTKSLISIVASGIMAGYVGTYLTSNWTQENTKSRENDRHIDKEIRKILQNFEAIYSFNCTDLELNKVKQYISESEKGNLNSVL